MNREEIVKDIVETIPFNGLAKVYDNGEVAYMQQNSMTKAEFDGEVKTIARINIAHNQVSLFWESNDRNIFEDNEQTEEITEALTEWVANQLDEQIEEYEAYKKTISRVDEAI